MLVLLLHFVTLSTVYPCLGSLLITFHIHNYINRKHPES